LIENSGHIVKNILTKMKISKENICFDCSSGIKVPDGVMTVHVGHCDYCLGDDKQVAPIRWYGYPMICEKDGIVQPIFKGVNGNAICPVCRTIL